MTAAQVHRRAEVRPFDFRRPNKLNRDHIRTLQIVQETFARQFSTVLSSTLRAVSSVTVLSIEQHTYDEFVRATPNPTHIAMLSIHPLPGVAILQMPLNVALTAVDFMLGGHGKGTVVNRALTDIETGLVRNLSDRVLRELSYAFESVVPMDPQIVQTESNPQFAQVAGPSDMVVVITLDVRIEHATGHTRLCFPYASLQPVLENFTGTMVLNERDPESVARAQQVLSDRLTEIACRVAVQFDPVTLTSGEIVDLEVGDVIPLQQPLESAVTITVDGTPTFLGRPARKGKRLACQVLGTIAEVQPR